MALSQLFEESQRPTKYRARSVLGIGSGGAGTFVYQTQTYRFVDVQKTKLVWPGCGSQLSASRTGLMMTVVTGERLVLEGGRGGGDGGAFLRPVAKPVCG